MSVYEFSCCTTGYAKSHGVKDTPEGAGMSEERARDLGIID